MLQTSASGPEPAVRVIEKRTLMAVSRSDGGG